MAYPIVSVTTSDHLQLFGLLSEALGADTVLLNIHGTASSFYMEGFEGEYAAKLPGIGISTLFVNNRGHHVLESWQKAGAAIERFEDCLIDIDTWIEFCLERGYKKIILQGHSLGTEKVVYYMHQGNHASKVCSVILLGFADSYGWQERFFKDHPGIKDKLFTEAKELVAVGKGEQLLTNYWRSHADTLPQSAESFLNFFSPGSELSKALPLRQGGELAMYQNIQVPILCVIGERDEWTLTSLEAACELMRKENSRAEVYVVPDADHSFSGKDRELAQIVRGFLEKVLNRA